MKNKKMTTVIEEYHDNILLVILISYYLK